MIKEGSFRSQQLISIMGTASEQNYDNTAFWNLAEKEFQVAFELQTSNDLRENLALVRKARKIS